MAKTNYYGFLIYCIIIILTFDQFGVVTSVPQLLGGKHLKIGVPCRSGFTEFVDAKIDPTTHQLVHVSGYSIDIFNATVYYILDKYGFNVSYEFKPLFIQTTAQKAATNNMFRRFDNQYDAVVGDVSIVANRTEFVDFTLPYTESGVRMLVRVGHGRHLNMWIFLSPFSWDLWLSIVIACVCIGATIQFMERKIHNDADVSIEGSQRRQLLKGISIIWLPLAQLVLPERESVAKSCSKFVLVIWLILAFVLMQSYTASLSSILTVNQLQPNYPSLDDLKRNGENVGYQTGSFVLGMLVNKFNLDKSKLRSISNIEDYRKALDKGTRNGGVAAVFDEIPYIKLFINKYGSKYTMVGPHYRIGGFGFIFPLNSNLTAYFSRAILNVTQNDEFMRSLGRKYFGSDDYDVLDDSDQLSSNSDAPSLTTLSFAGLFMITGVATVLALVVSERHIWREAVTLAKVCSQKLLLSPVWKKYNNKQQPPESDNSTSRGNNDGSSINEERNGISERPSPNSNIPFEPIMHV